MLESSRGKDKTTYKDRPIRITLDFSIESLKAKGPGQMSCRNSYLNYLKGRERIAKSTKS